MKRYIIPVFIPHFGCPHQCVFCNQRKITGLLKPVTAKDVSKIIQKHLSIISEPRIVEVAYYGGSFTALPMDCQSGLLRPAYDALLMGKIHAIRVSTRPDCISTPIVKNLLKHGVSTIELGAQSLDDRVLAVSERGHTCEDIANAVSVIKENDVSCGLQLMIGLPEENHFISLKSAYKAVKLKPDFVRLYPTVVIKDTKLAEMFLQGQYKPLSLNEAVRRVAQLKFIFIRNNIPIIRTGLQATEELSGSCTVLAGPYHPSFGEMVDAYLFNMMIAKILEHMGGEDITIGHHRREASKVRGVKNNNLHHWKEEYKVKTLSLQPIDVASGQLIVKCTGYNFVTNLAMLSEV